MGGVHDAASLEYKFEVCSPDALESNLAKIISLAERNGGTVTARGVLRIFDSKYRPTSQAVQKWFGDLETMKYGEVTEKGRSIRFSLYETSAFSALVQNLDSTSIPNAEDNLRTVSASSAFIAQKHKISKVNAEERGGNAEDNLRVLKPPVDKALNSNAENAEVFTPSIETSHSSMMSRTIEPTEFAEQIRKALANFDRSLAVQVWDGLKAKVKRKLREEVKSHLTPTENENFKLLVAAGFLQGTRVKYVGSRFSDLDGLDMTVDNISPYSEIACRKPDGSFTTWMKPEELRKL